VQTIIPLAGHGAIRLTTARYYTPSGRSIQAKGIVPDINVPQSKVESLETGQQRHEADLRGALANPEKSDSKDKPAAAPKGGTSDKGKAPGPQSQNRNQNQGGAGKAPAPAATDNKDSKEKSGPGDEDETAVKSDSAAEDYQLSRALDLLRGIALYNARVSN
jgi:carboxyl-terminal processing protease